MQPRPFPRPRPHGFQTPSRPTGHDKPLPLMPPLQDEDDGRRSWVDVSQDSGAEGDVDGSHIEYLRSAMQSRPRAPPVSYSAEESTWSPSSDQPFADRSPSASYSGEYSSMFATPDPPSPTPHTHPRLVRKASDADDSSFSESSPSRSFLRPPKGAALPDPSHFPDPYPYRSPLQYLSSTPPTLSSGGSSTASTRSSAYTSSGSALASGDYGMQFQVASGEDDEVIGVGITSDEVVHILDQEHPLPSSGSHSRVPIDQTRWSQSYSASLGSRSSLVRSNSTGGYEKSNANPSLQPKPIYDLNWQAVDERDEVDLTSEGETEGTDLEGDDMDEEEKEEERTAAIVIAEEGRGLIVHGEGVATASLQVQTGTTHLLVGSSSTPSALPLFLTNTLTNVGRTLLALDISANFLGALPPALDACVNLEELNVSSNPLRALPLFIAHLTSLRVLIADSTGLSTLPAPLAALDKLHTLSIRRNKMHSLPSWFCLLPSMETLLVDGNPFQGPWKALMDPLLSKEPTTPMYSPSTPMFPLPSAVTHDAGSVTDTDTDDLSDSPAPEADDRSPEDEDTITPARALLERAATSPAPVTADSVAPPRPGVTRTRTTPNRAYFDRSRSTADTRRAAAARTVSQHHTRKVPDSGYFGDHEVRRMKSAGELRPPTSPIPPSPALAPSPPSPPSRQALSHYGSSASSSNLLSTSDAAAAAPRFGSLGVAAGSHASSTRPPLDKSLWDRTSQRLDAPSHNVATTRRNSSRRPSSPPSTGNFPESLEKVVRRPRSRSQRKEDKEKNKDKESSGRWGFLKKMSMSKLRSDTPPSSRPSTAVGRPGATPLSGVAEAASPRSMSSPMVSRLTPQIDVRLSSTGPLGVDLPPTPLMSPSIVEPKSEEPDTTHILTASSGHSPNLLSPSPLSFLAPAPVTSRTAKRRSFLPIDGPPTLSIPVPPAAAFLPGLTVTDGNGAEARAMTPSPVLSESMEQAQRREEDRAREAYTRALRSVMAYLRDMNDLSLAQQPNTMSVYGASLPDVPGSGVRSRRPTLVDGVRAVSEVSVASLGSVATSRTGSSEQLRSMESIARLRSLSSAHSVSIATTDSGGSGGGNEERKFKDDSGKRALIIREIVETERTYVKGMQELVDIYIKPASAPVNLLGGVSSAKETVVPTAERKIVFSGLDALFSFHKESFLPALEFAAAPVLKPAAVLAKEDADGHISANAAKAVANTFVSHAAFMKMYSTYINNFDHSVERIKHWISDRPSTGTSSPPSAATLGSSNGTGSVVSLGLAISGINAPGLAADVLAASSGVAPLTSSQRKRIKSYLKRCRLNPRHSQLNLEGYLLLPVQRIPRYRLLLEELGRSTPPTEDYVDPLDKAFTTISSLATNMNEGKRESESRRKLVQWQAKIRGKFPSPLVQPHRRLIMDGPLLLTRVVRKATIAFEVINSQGDTSNVQVECLSPEQTPRSLIGILCNDLLVLCRDPSEGRDPHSPVDLWAVLRMQTLPQPASIVHGNVLRLVDNKAILYFEASSTSVALTWFRAINLHIPTSKV